MSGVFLLITVAAMVIMGLLHISGLFLMTS